MKDHHFTSERGLLWRFLFALCAFLNDRFLPEGSHLEATLILQAWSQGMAWCRRYLQARDPGPLQFRGAPLAVKPQGLLLKPVRFSYRGQPVALTLPHPSEPIPSPYVPAYWRWLRTWMLDRGLAEADRPLVASVNPTRVYRGHPL